MILCMFNLKSYHYKIAVSKDLHLFKPELFYLIYKINPIRWTTSIPIWSTPFHGIHCWHHVRKDTWLIVKCIYMIYGINLSRCELSMHCYFVFLKNRTFSQINSNYKISFNKMNLKMSSANCQSFCSSLSVLNKLLSASVHWPRSSLLASMFTDPSMISAHIIWLYVLWQRLSLRYISGPLPWGISYIYSYCPYISCCFTHPVWGSVSLISLACMYTILEQKCHFKEFVLICSLRKLSYQQVPVQQRTQSSSKRHLRFRAIRPKAQYIWPTFCVNCSCSNFVSL